jgi:predicted transcriptional regulator
MATFTSTLPDKLLKQLADKAEALSLPKNKIIEKALALYLEHLEKAEYVRSYRSASKDKDILSLAEEGMEDYLRQLRS